VGESLISNSVRITNTSTPTLCNLVKMTTKTKGMYVEFFDTALPPDDDEDIEFPTASMEAMPADIGDRAQSEHHGDDSDSVDNCCSKCITNCLSDFITPPKRMNVDVRGIGGSIRANLMGAVKWSIEDDKGVVHSFLLPSIYYNADSPYRLLSPNTYRNVSPTHVAND
jgi:hypothetical protein